MNSALASPLPDRSRVVERALIAAFLEKVPDYVYFKDRQSRFIAVSKSLVHYLGQQSASEVLGRTDADFFTPVLAQQALDDEQRIIRTGQPMLGKIECETRFDGQVAWV